MAIFTFFLPVICLVSLFSDATALPVNKEAKKNFESEEFTVDPLEDNNSPSTASSDSKKLLNTLPSQGTTEVIMNRHKRSTDQSSTSTTTQNPGIVYKPWLFSV